MEVARPGDIMKCALPSLSQSHIRFQSVGYQVPISRGQVPISLVSGSNQSGSGSNQSNAISNQVTVPVRSGARQVSVRSNESVRYQAGVSEAQGKCQ
jgi:hypothetical protein